MKLRLVLVLGSLTLLAGCKSTRPENVVLTAPDAAKRAAAAEKLGHASGSARQAAAQALALATADPDAKVREKAVAGLAALGGPEARQALLDVAHGRQYSRAALVQYQIANKAASTRGGPNPDILAPLARAQFELGQYKDAEGTYVALDKAIEGQDPQQAQKHLKDLQSGYDQLKSAYEKAGDTDAADRCDKASAKVAETLKKAPPSGGGMFGGMGGDMGGLQIQP